MRSVPTSLTEAESLFLRWLVEDGAEEKALEELLAAHPDEAARIAEIHSRWRSLAERELLEAEGSVVDLLSSVHGEEVDPRVALADAREPEGTPSARERSAIRRGNYTFHGEVIEGDPPRIAVARDENLRRPVAMKVFRDPAASGLDEESSEAAWRGFLREAALLARLDHPGLVPVHELGVDRDGTVFFTMPRLRGERFDRVIASLRGEPRDWPLPRAIDVVIGVCETLAAVHARGVIHGELDPENVLVGEYGEVLITGWGRARSAWEVDVDALALRVHPNLSLAELFGDRPGSREATGAPPAPANRPEATEPDPRLDIRAVGGMIEQLLAEACSRNGSAPVELAAIARKARNGRSAESYSSTAELAGDLRAFLEHRLVSALHPGALAELRLWVRRHRGLSAIAISTLVLLLGCLGVYSLEKAEERDKLRECSVALTLDYLTVRVEELWPVRAEEDWKQTVQDWLFLVEDAKREQREARARLAELEERYAAPLEESLRRQRKSNLDQDLNRERVARFEALWEDLARPLLEKAAAESLTDSESNRLELLTTRRDELWEANPSPELRGIAAFDLQAPDSIQRVFRLQQHLFDWALFSRSKPTDTTAPRKLPARGPLLEVERAWELVQTWESKASEEPTRAAWFQAMHSVFGESLTAGEIERDYAPRFPLLPLGENQQGFWEFWDVQTGSQPELDQPPRAKKAMIFVLIPGDPAAGIEPFFVSKCEMAQDQWHESHNLRSYYREGATESEGHHVSGASPAESVEKSEVNRVLRHLGMELPTEIQWRLAAAGKSESQFWWGDDVGLATRREILARPEDPDRIHFPVGSLAPNPFGLHDVLGNVGELCWAEEGDPRLLVVCGGNYQTAPEELAPEESQPFGEPNPRTGLRPILVLDPRPRGKETP